MWMGTRTSVYKLFWCENIPRRYHSFDHSDWSNFQRWSDHVWWLNKPTMLACWHVGLGSSWRSREMTPRIAMMFSRPRPRPMVPYPVQVQGETPAWAQFFRSFLRLEGIAIIMGWAPSTTTTVGRMGLSLWLSLGLIRGQSTCFCTSW